MKSSLDACVIRDNRVFAYGWCFDPESAAAQMALSMTLSDGVVVRLPVTMQKERPDVAQAFPDEPHAGYSGWLAYAAWEGAPAARLSLTGRLENGRAFDCPLDVDTLPQPRAARSVRARARELARRARRWMRGAAPGHDETDETGAGWLDEVRSFLGRTDATRCPLAIDHSMGGGATVFSKEWLHERLRSRPVVLVLSFDISSLRYTLQMHTPEGVARTLTFLTEPASALARSGIVDDVLYNDAVSFPRPELVPDWLAAFCRVPATALTIAIHDYLAVCPSQFLLNDAGRFCGVPDVAECERCLPRNDNEFARLYPAAAMPVWRERWGRALALADEIVCFSASSESLLRRAHPGLSDATVRVRPHPVRTFSAPAAVNHTGALHIGVVGAIGWHKGAGVLQELAAEIARRRLPARITVIGSVHAPCDESVLRMTGPFAHDDLPRLVAESGANVFLLPSICPETFSYVTHELIALRVPLACFDFGAPADRVATYPFGRVMPRTDSADLLDRLLCFHRELAASQGGAP